MKQVNTVVLGAGPGGYVAAIRLGQLGVDTLLVERGTYGGVCLNVGCIPSKALIHVAKSYESIEKMKDFGVLAQTEGIDMQKTQAWKEKIVAQLTGGIQTLVKKNKVTILEGEGCFTGPHTMRVTTKDGDTELQFQQAIIATGSRPIEIPSLPFGGRIIDSTGALALKEVPKHLIVIGGGYIGLELGFVYRKLGAEVTIVEMMDSILPGFDGDVVKTLARKLKKDQFNVLTGAKASAYRETEQGIELDVEHKGTTTTLQGDYVFVSIGRTPNSGGFGLETTGVALNDRGFIPTDKQCRTNIPHLFAIGDVAGQPMLAHHASYQGEVAAEVIAGHKTEDISKSCPAVVFTDPEVATAGMSEKEALDQGFELAIGMFPFAALGKAKTQNDTEGFVKVIADKKTEQILGVVMVGHGVSDLIGEAQLGIEMCAFLDDLSLTIHPHPTLTEALMEAAKKAKGQAIHVLN
jgi:dihydrolipoamide dehydrogenase